MKKKNLLIIPVILMLIFGGGLSVFSFAHAEDDEYEDRDENEDEDEDDKESQEKENEDVSKPKTYQQTFVVSPAKIITEQQLQKISLPDRDRDGIPDGEDIHPDIAEIYIVKDENLNGVVDAFEYENK